MRPITISDDVRQHLAPHFGPGLPGSKFYSTSPEALLDRAQRLFPTAFDEAVPDSDGRIRLSLTFPEDIGVSNVVSIDDLTADEQKRVATTDRQGRMVRCVKTGRAIPTRKCQVILASNWQLITMFPGEMAPPLPASPDVPDEYWDRHVFIDI